jgi:hypothetical protein
LSKSNEEYRQEENIIHNILRNNYFPLQNQIHKRQQNYMKNQKSPKESHLHNPPQKMVCIHLHWKRNLAHYQYFQTGKFTNSIPHQQYTTKTLDPQQHPTRQIHTVRYLQTNMP